MQKKYLFTLLISLSFNSLIFSQETKAESIINHMSALTTLDLRAKELAGSPYSNEVFELAKFSKYDEKFLMRYNAYQDQMEVKIEDNIYGLPKNLNYSVIFLKSKKTYKIFQYHQSNQYRSGFFLVLYQNENYSLIHKELIKAFEEVLPISGYHKYIPPTLKKVKGKNYIGYKNNTAQELPKKKKDFFNLFSTNSKKVEKYAKSNHLSTKNTDDLIKIFSYYNSLK